MLLSEFLGIYLEGSELKTLTDKFPDPNDIVGEKDEYDDRDALLIEGAMWMYGKIEEVLKEEFLLKE